VAERSPLGVQALEDQDKAGGGYRSGDPGRKPAFPIDPAIAIVARAPADLSGFLFRITAEIDRGMNLNSHSTLRDYRSILG
jgi:hypothetical protein